MWKQKLGLSLFGNLGISMEEEIRLIKKTGFDAVSPGWTPDAAALESWVNTAKEVGLALHFMHAPFGKAADMWRDDAQKGQAALDELLACLQDCVKYEIPIMVAHTYIGFEQNDGPTEIGLMRYGELVKAAKACGVKIALENTEGEEYLFALMEHFKDEPTVGFCWDSGHEMCYNRSRDLLNLYGDRLLVTHLNDNLGISRYDGTTFWTDDLHLLPFDGIADWDELGHRLKKSTLPAYLNFELTIRSKPERHENDVYAAMEPTAYLAECYKRACRVAMKIR